MNSYPGFLKPSIKMALGLALSMFIVIAGYLMLVSAKPQPPIKVGVLHALTGTMATSEKPLVQMLQLAVEQLNQQGGLLGRSLELVIVDTESDADIAAQQAEKLIVDDQVSVVFGCWTSACRKAVKPVFEQHNHLLFYPVQYEGLEASNHIFYTGSSPNQQIVPGARWAMQQFGTRVLLVGSDYVFPRIANMILADMISANQGEIVAEFYKPLGNQAFDLLIEQIQLLKPDVILNTLNGDSNHAFFNGLVASGLQDIPVMSFSVAEPELQAWGGGRLTQHYGVWGFFQSLSDPLTQDLVANYQQRFGENLPVSDPMIASYLGVQLWARAVAYEQSANPRQVNNVYLQSLSMPAPGSKVVVERTNRHLWRQLRIGHVQPDGQYQQVYVTDHLIRPTPWPTYRTRYDWEQARARLGL
ncbi:urea ABC transporter substrate-binding protein [Thiomicrospira microaerophila]|uniref:urea ABC transporter substrate-binding protein n=1 Tax=Thiomicrospira microaerophila TaxID=406020 RepID=UPI00200BD572|nr:urea ABC transporter substrate-binding protein [Thiomicrospira microaerophila]UQB41966.1 urea ABC transporter substrate-binding protein [Thiomicrospira microaerophila]